MDSGMNCVSISSSYSLARSVSENFVDVPQRVRATWISVGGRPRNPLLLTIDTTFKTDVPSRREIRHSGNPIASSRNRPDHDHLDSFNSISNTRARTRARKPVPSPREGGINSSPTKFGETAVHNHSLPGPETSRETPRATAAYGMAKSERTMG